MSLSRLYPTALPAAPSRLLVAGDTHADPFHLRYLAQHARAHHCQAILQLGDFGFWPLQQPSFLHSTLRTLEAAKLNLYFLEGNHEDYPRLLDDNFLELDGFRYLGLPGPGEHSLWHIPRGHRWTWHDLRFLAVGGGHSIDKQLRHPGHDWFPQELLSQDELGTILAAEPAQVDICAFHDAPAGAPLPLQLYPIPEADHNRERLAVIARHVRPGLILHAHYHLAYQGTLSLAASALDPELQPVRAAIVGLDCNLNPGRSWLVLNLVEIDATTIAGWRSGRRTRL